MDIKILHDHLLSFYEDVYEFRKHLDEKLLTESLLVSDNHSTEWDWAVCSRLISDDWFRIYDGIFQRGNAFNRYSMTNPAFNLERIYGSRGLTVNLEKDEIRLEYRIYGGVETFKLLTRDIDIEMDQDLDVRRKSFQKDFPKSIFDWDDDTLIMIKLAS